MFRTTPKNCCVDCCNCCRKIDWGMGPKIVHRFKPLLFSVLWIGTIALLEKFNRNLYLKCVATQTCSFLTKNSPTKKWLIQSYRQVEWVTQQKRPMILGDLRLNLRGKWGHVENFRVQLLVRVRTTGTTGHRHFAYPAKVASSSCSTKFQFLNFTLPTRTVSRKKYIFVPSIFECTCTNHTCTVCSSKGVVIVMASLGFGKP